ncbi:condensation domain-containing protein [Paraburkholderia fungorum]|uniref:condensation domain-containing protein n=1 Tax=Paraburkholderia fungorum TaxID=134537 RepID=UPI0038BD5EE4
MTVVLPMHSGPLAGTRTLDEADLFALEDALTDAAGTGDIAPFDPQQVLLPQLRELAPTVQSIAVLAPSQRDMFIHYVRAPADPTYVLGFGIGLQPDVDPEKWTESLRAAEQAAPTFRSRYFEFAEGFFQVLDSAVVSPVEIVYLDREDPDAARKATQAALDCPFDLFEGAVRHLLLIGEQGATAVLVCHHIAIDTTSAVLFFNLVFSAYTGGHVRTDTRFIDWATQAVDITDTPQALAERRDMFSTVEPLLHAADVAAQSVQYAQRAQLDGADVARLTSWCTRHKLQPASLLKCIAGCLLARRFKPAAAFVLYDVVSGRTLNHFTTVGCLYRILGLPFPVADIATVNVAELATRFQRLHHEQVRSPMSLLAASGLPGNAGAPILLNYFDHAGVAPLLEPTGASHPGLQPAQFSVHERMRIGPGETHLRFDRDRDGLRVSVRSRHPAFSSFPFADEMTTAVKTLVSGAAST